MAVSINSGAFSLGSFAIRALLFEVYTKAPGVWKAQASGHNLRHPLAYRPRVLGLLGPKTSENWVLEP